MAVLLALLASLLWGTSDFLGGRTSRRLPALTVVGVSQLVALLGLVPLAVGLGGLHEPRSYVVPGMLAGVAGLLALSAFYRALATGRMGVVAPIAALGVVVPVLLGLLDGERPGPVRLAGIALGVVGVVLASGPELSGSAGARPLLLAAGAGLGFGTVLVLLAQANEGGTATTVVLSLLVMRLASVVLVALAIGVLSRRARHRAGGAARLGRFSRADLPVLVLIGVFDLGANGAFAAASQGSLVSVTSVLASLYPVVTVLLARQLLDERLKGAQATGVVLALGGVVLLASG